MSSDPLPNGEYYIRNGYHFVGRDYYEDKSLLPKKVCCPPDRGPDLVSCFPLLLVQLALTYVEFLQWLIEALPNGRYSLKVRGAPTGESNKLVYAFLVEEEKAEEWVITERRTDRDGKVYT
jgi:hypothetical protein